MSSSEEENEYFERDEERDREINERIKQDMLGTFVTSICYISHNASPLSHRGSMASLARRVPLLSSSCLPLTLALANAQMVFISSDWPMKISDYKISEQIGAPSFGIPRRFSSFLFPLFLSSSPRRILIIIRSLQAPAWQTIKFGRPLLRSVLTSPSLVASLHSATSFLP